ncbi:non-homologous end-joining DNA ligase [Rhodospirillaceae bacterium SYSU D60014]|uniref:non-homologous end-joining DNA ligase n=1 Tax=Virgifigura deserti TaxID=2268457 RepID=UPI000E675931
MTHQAPVPRARASRASPHRAAIEIAGVRLTHPDRLLYAGGEGEGLTKRGLAEYYAAVADWILPHLVGRPLSLVRCPAGQGSKCFFQRHAGSGVPDDLKRLPVAERNGAAIYLAVDNLAGLVSLVQMGVLEIHPWGARADDPERPDRLIFDLDPAEGLSWDRVVEAALELRARLTALGLESFVKTTGGKGLHVVLPLARRQDWEQARGFAKAMAEAMARDRPSAFTSAAAKAARPGKIFIDYLRNAHGASAIAPYSTRARPGAPVATPLAWAELEQPALRPGDFTVATLPRRLSGLGRDPGGGDPWEGLSKTRQSITRPAQRAVGLSV